MKGNEGSSLPVEIDATSLLRIGELAKACKKTVRALHLYEELGLLKPVLRSKGGFRLYEEKAIERVRFISRLQDADVSLQELKIFLQKFDQIPVAPEAMNQLRFLLEQKKAEVRAQQQKLANLELDLHDALQYLEGCKPCRTKQHVEKCDACSVHGHDGTQPLLIAGIHQGQPIHFHSAKGVHGNNHTNNHR